MGTDLLIYAQMAINQNITVICPEVGLKDIFWCSHTSPGWGEWEQTSELMCEFVYFVNVDWLLFWTAHLEIDYMIDYMIDYIYDCSIRQNNMILIFATIMPRLRIC